MKTLATRSVALAFLLGLSTGAAAQEAAPAAAPPAAPDLASIKAELDALKATVEAQAALQAAQDPNAAADASEENKVQIYGFMDAGLNRLWKDHNYLSFIGSNTRGASFVTGHSNVYIDARPSPNWRGLLETRFSLYPHGLQSSATSGPDADGNITSVRYDDRTFDVTSPSGSNKVIWSGIILERAQIDWTPSDLFKLRIGYFLTPYGIWNVDHGTPTLISLFLPLFVASEAIPLHQTGVEMFGSTGVDAMTFGYHLYVSNGRTPGIVDITDNKAVGGRFFGKYLGDNMLTLGVSWYVGQLEDDQLYFKVDAVNNRVGFEPNALYRGHEYAVGGDVAYDSGGLRVRYETIMNRSVYEDGKHPPAMAAPGEKAFVPDRFDLFMYLLGAYRIGAFEPYFYGETRYSKPRVASGDRSYVPSVGLNIYFTPAVQLKAQYARVIFRSGSHDGSESNFHYFTTRLVLAF